MDALQLFFSAAGFNDADVLQITGHFTRRAFKKGEYFVEQGQTSKYLGFVESGFFQLSCWVFRLFAKATTL